MAPVERKDFTIGVPVSGVYEEIWNTELEEMGRCLEESTIRQFSLKRGLWKDYQQTLTFTLPALGASIWKVKRKVRSKVSKTKKIVVGDLLIVYGSVQALKKRAKVPSPEEWEVLVQSKKGNQ